MLARTRRLAFIQIIITSLLWGSSFVLIRFGLDEIGPLTLAGLRYTAAGVFLLPIMRFQRICIKDFRKHLWLLALLGVLQFTIGNGFVGLALKILPSTTVSLLTNLTSPIILLLGIIWLKENPGLWQYLGLFLTLIGTVLFFFPLTVNFDNRGLFVIAFGLMGFSLYSLIGRLVARSREVPYLMQTALPFIIGGGALLLPAILMEGLPVITPKGFLILAWMVVFNSIIGYLLYNQAISQLSVVETNVMLKLTPFFTALVAWLLLGETITLLQIIAMSIVLTGTFLVQLEKTSVLLNN